MTWCLVNALCNLEDTVYTATTIYTTKTFLFLNKYTATTFWFVSLCHFLRHTKLCTCSWRIQADRTWWHFSTPNPLQKKKKTIGFITLWCEVWHHVLQRKHARNSIWGFINTCSNYLTFSLANMNVWNLFK